jgi:iron uptake system component EfeO
MKGTSRRRSAAVLVPVLLTLAACSPSASEPAGSAGAGATTVNVTLQEWAVVPDAETAPAGEITFAVTNDGPDDVHEFVILRTDLAPDDLPTDEHGAVDESGEGIELVDEIEDIPVGETQEVTVDLEAGNYVLLCNIYSADEDEAHFAEGMRIAFVVE